MSGRSAFLKKEFLEIFRTYKIYVILAVFLVIGFGSPLLAKMTPEILKSYSGTSNMGGVAFTIPEPTAIDAYLQFFKNLNFMALLAVVFSLIGLVAEEKVRGSAALMLTKPVPRWSFIVSKYLASAFLVTAATLLAYGACFYYTVIIFKNGMFALSAGAALLSVVYFLFILALTLLASTVSRSVALSGGLSVGGLIVVSLLPQFGKALATYTPGALPDFENRILTKTATLGDAVPALLITLGVTALLIAVTVQVFRKQEL